MIYEEEVLTDLDQLRSRYQVLRRLGRDGPFSVYAVRSRDSHKHFLVKVMEDPGEGRTKARALHLWQAHTVRPLDHPKLMVLHAVHYLQGGAVALAMDRRRGRTLGELLEETGPLSARRAEHIMRDIGEALAYLHSRDVVHRSVRPESIFLDQDRGHARLSHFGIHPFATGDEAADGGASTLKLFAYLAPEQIAGQTVVDGRRLGARSDLYSLGLVGYAILTGRDPWPAHTLDELLESRKRDPLPPIESLRPDVPDNLREAIEGCIARNSRHRWKHAGEFLATLDPSSNVEASEAAKGIPSARNATLTDGVRLITAALTARPHAGSASRLGITAAVAVAGVMTVSVLRGGSDPVVLDGNEAIETPGYELPVAPAPVQEASTPSTPAADGPPARAATPGRLRPEWEDPYLDEPAIPEPVSGSVAESLSAPRGQQFVTSTSPDLLGSPIRAGDALHLLGAPLAVALGHER